jgi:hypothetical protein
MLQLATDVVADCVVPSSPIFVTLKKEAPGSSETSVLTRATRRNNPEDTILREENQFSHWGSKPQPSDLYVIASEIIVKCVQMIINGRRALSSGILSRQYQLKRSSGTLYCVALVRTGVSKNVSSQSSGFLRVTGWFHRVTGWFLRVTGWFHRVTGWFLRVTGWFHRATGWIHRVTGFS